MSETLCQSVVSDAPGPECGARPARKWALLGVLLLGAFLMPLDFSIVNVAIPIIETQLGARGSEVQLLISLYATSYAALLITGGRLGDIYGRGRLFQVGLVGFMIASALCGLAPGITPLLAGRLLQGLTAALMAPQVLAIVRQVFDEPARARAVGLYGAMVGLATIIGQFFGGVLVSLDWRLIFLINLPIGLVVLTGARRLLPRDIRLKAIRLDVGGAALLTCALLLLVYPLTQGSPSTWSALDRAAFIVSFPLLLAFCAFENILTKRGGQPLIRLRLFRERAFAIGTVLSLLVYWFAAFFLSYALYLQRGAGWLPVQSGLAVIPFGLAFLVGSTNAERLVIRLGHRAAAIGYACMLCGLTQAVICLSDASGPSVALLASLMPVGFGMGIVLPSVVRIVLADVAARDAGMVSGVLNTMLQIGGALSVALIGGLFFGRLGTQPTLADYASALAYVCAAIAGVYAVSLVLLQLLHPFWRSQRSDK